VGGVPATGYEFSLNATGPFQTSNVFPISTPELTTVYIRQQGVYQTDVCLKYQELISEDEISQLVSL
jgi:hypothetical protein